MSVTITRDSLQQILAELTGQDVKAEQASDITPHPATYRGLVTPENKLVAVIASDLNFAHRCGAALAMIPATAVEDDAEEVEDHLIEFYGEVANVLSRLANEAYAEHLRLDPGFDIPAEVLQKIIDNGTMTIGANTTIDPHGSGAVGIWFA
ncbi:MAG: hypothetical protein AAF467_04775 [Actinomycetota bacterium]